MEKRKSFLKCHTTTAIKYPIWWCKVFSRRTNLCQIWSISLLLWSFICKFIFCIRDFWYLYMLYLYLYLYSNLCIIKSETVAVAWFARELEHQFPLPVRVVRLEPGSIIVDFMYLYFSFLYFPVESIGWNLWVFLLTLWICIFLFVFSSGGRSVSLLVLCHMLDMYPLYHLSETTWHFVGYSQISNPARFHFKPCSECVHRQEFGMIALTLCFGLIWLVRLSKKVPRMI